MLQKPLEPYHLVWLDAHPRRSEAWLRERFKDGFHIHHLDGDHSNDSADNLVLIEEADHMRLHGAKGWGTRVKGARHAGRPKIEQPPRVTRPWPTADKRRVDNLLRGRTAYEMRLANPAFNWGRIAIELGFPSVSARGLAAVYAASAGLTFPPVFPVDMGARSLTGAGDVATVPMPSRMGRRS